MRPQGLTKLRKIGFFQSPGMVRRMNVKWRCEQKVDQTVSQKADYQNLFTIQLNLPH